MSQFSFAQGDYGVLLTRKSIDQFGHHALFANELTPAFATLGVPLRLIDYQQDIAHVHAALADKTCAFFICFNGFGAEITTPNGAAPAFLAHDRPLFDFMHDCPAHDALKHQANLRYPQRTVLATDYRYATIAEDMGLGEAVFVPSVTFPGQARPKVRPIDRRRIDILLPMGISPPRTFRSKDAPATAAKLALAKEVFKRVCGAAIEDWRIDPISELLAVCRQAGLQLDLTAEDGQFLLTTVLDFVKFSRRRRLIDAIAHLPVTVVADRPYDGQLPAGSKLRFAETRTAIELLAMMGDSRMVVCPTPHMTGFHERALGAFSAGAVVVSPPNRMLESSFVDGREIVFFHDGRALAERLQQLLDRPDDLQEISDRGLEKAERLFPPRRFAETVLGLLALRTASPRRNLASVNAPDPIGDPSARATRTEPRPGEAPRMTSASSAVSSMLRAVGLSKSRGVAAWRTEQSNDPEAMDLLVIDDMFPTQFSPFRTLEYAHYLSFFDTVILSTEQWRPWVPTGDFDDHLAALPIDPSLKPRIRRFSKDFLPRARLGYATFLSNAARSLPFFEKRKIPFILQLYPGGGFQIDQPEIDEKLKTVVSSPYCRKVITTQSLTRNYLTERIGCDPAKVEFIFGGVFESRGDFDFQRDKPRYLHGKDTLDLCFVAHKYKASLSAKGYDSFVAIARRLADSFPQLRFHVVGNFAANDMELGDAADRFTFYGARPHAFLAGFFSRMDMIVSVNRPFSVLPGAFDGFPTGACIEAGFRGVLNCINDPLGLNETFVHDRDLVMLDFDEDRSVSLLHDLLANPDRLYRLAYANWRRFHEVLGIDRQLWARSRIIANEITRRKDAPLKKRAAGTET